MRVPSQQEVMTTLRERIPSHAACVAARAGPAMRSAAASSEAKRLRSALGEVCLAFLACCSALCAYFAPTVRYGIFSAVEVLKARQEEAKGVEAAIFGLALGLWVIIEAAAFRARKFAQEYTGPAKDVVSFAGETFAQAVEWLDNAAKPEEAPQETSTDTAPDEDEKSVKKDS